MMSGVARREGSGATNLVNGSDAGSHIVELLGVEGKAESSLETGAQDLSVTWKTFNDQGFRVDAYAVPRATTPLLLILALSEAPEAWSRTLQADQNEPILQMRYTRLSTDFESNTTVGSLGIVDSLRTSLYVLVDAVVVASGEGLEVVETVSGDSVFSSVVANGSSVARDCAFGDIVGSLSTNEETVATDNSVSGEKGALRVTVRTDDA